MKTIVQRVDELRVVLRFNKGEPVRLMDLEEFCSALRNAGAVGGLIVGANKATGDAVIELAAVQLNPDRPAVSA